MPITTTASMFCTPTCNMSGCEIRAARPANFRLRIGQGEVEYGRIVNQLVRCHYHRMLSVDIRDLPEPAYEMPPEVRKLKYLLESLI